MPMQLTIDYQRDLVLGTYSSGLAEQQQNPIEYALSHAHVTISQANPERQVLCMHT